MLSRHAHIITQLVSRSFAQLFSLSVGQLVSQSVCYLTASLRLGLQHKLCGTVVSTTKVGSDDKLLFLGVYGTFLMLLGFTKKWSVQPRVLTWLVVKHSNLSQNLRERILTVCKRVVSCAVMRQTQICIRWNLNWVTQKDLLIIYSGFGIESTFWIEKGLSLRGLSVKTGPQRTSALFTRYVTLHTVLCSCVTARADSPQRPTAPAESLCGIFPTLNFSFGRGPGGAASSTGLGSQQGFFSKWPHLANNNNNSNRKPDMSNISGRIKVQQCVARAAGVPGTQ